MALNDPTATAFKTNSPFVVTPMHLDDVPTVAALEQRSFPTPWSALSYQHELANNKLSHYWVIRNTSPSCLLPPILAYGGYWILGDEAHISTISSHPDQRRCKLGEWLMLVLLGEARKHGALEVTLEVRVSNDAAIALYKSLGFEEVGLRKQYYSATYERPTEDALLLTIFGLDAGRVWRPLALRTERVAATAQERLLARC